MKPWITIDSVNTPEGALELRQRGAKDFLLTVGGRVLMTSAAHGSEDDLARHAHTAIAGLTRPRVLLGGLGMGFTLRAALDRLPPTAEVLVVDLNPRIVAWCKGPLAPLTNAAIDDPRVKVRVDDVARFIAESPPGRFDAIVLDLYEGPNEARSRGRSREEDPLYGPTAVANTFRALAPNGVLAVWSEEPDPAYAGRLAAAGMREKHHRGGGRGSRAHIIYVATRP